MRYDPLRRGSQMLQVPWANSSPMAGPSLPDLLAQQRISSPMGDLLTGQGGVVQNPLMQREGAVQDQAARVAQLAGLADSPDALAGLQGKQNGGETGFMDGLMGAVGGALEPVTEALDPILEPAVGLAGAPFRVLDKLVVNPIQQMTGHPNARREWAVLMEQANRGTKELQEKAQLEATLDVMKTENPELHALAEAKLMGRDAAVKPHQNSERPAAWGQPSGQAGAMVPRASFIKDFLFQDRQERLAADIKRMNLASAAHRDKKAYIDQLISTTKEQLGLRKDRAGLTTDEARAKYAEKLYGAQASRAGSEAAISGAQARNAPALYGAQARTAGANADVAEITAAAAPEMSALDLIIRKGRADEAKVRGDRADEYYDAQIDSWTKPRTPAGEKPLSTGEAARFQQQILEREIKEMSHADKLIEKATELSQDPNTPAEAFKTWANVNLGPGWEKAFGKAKRDASGNWAYVPGEYGRQDGYNPQPDGVKAWKAQYVGERLKPLFDLRKEALAVGRPARGSGTGDGMDPVSLVQSAPGHLSDVNEIRDWLKDTYGFSHAAATDAVRKAQELEAAGQ